MDLASEAIMVRDSNGIVRFWNSGAEALYGWKRSEIVGYDLHQRLRTKFPVPVSEIQAVLASEGRWDGNLIQYTKDGAELTVACRKALKQRLNGNQGTVLEINRDITVQLQSEEALRRAERLAAMGRVAGIIAHEINNPLEAITNCFYLLRDHPSLDEEARSLANIGEQELMRVCHITRQTLGFYRESQQAMSISVAEIINDVLELQARRFQSSGILLSTEFRSKGVILGFPVELKQVFLNLIGNAGQAMPDGGRLRVRVDESTDFRTGQPGVSVTISDTGSGIEPKNAKHLFEPFFTTKSTKGTGLGLWMSKGIIQKYEGKIRFRSLRCFGSNTTCFRVFIPVNLTLDASVAKFQEAAG